MKTIETRLIEAAGAVRERAHAPYSGYRVGAALLDDSGRIHIGCNVENAAFPAGTCAEAGAISAMIAAGGTRIAALAAVGGSGALAGCTPCGGCRQRILEFAGPETRIIVLDDNMQPVSYSPAELLPVSFHLDHDGRGSR